MWPDLWSVLLLALLGSNASAKTPQEKASGRRAQQFLEQVISPRDNEQNSCKVCLGSYTASNALVLISVEPAYWPDRRCLLRLRFH